MELDDVFTVEPRWNLFRYLLSDGHVLDVRSPYRADSDDRARVLDEAKRRFGPDAQRAISGVTQLPADDLDAVE